SRYCRFLQENGAYTDYGDLVTQWVGESFAGIYKTDHLKYEGILVYTNRPYGGPYRGFGDPQLQFALEQHMDKMTESLGIDPVEFRLKNAVESGYVMPNGVPLKSCGLRECITKVAEEVGWKNRRQRIKVGRKVRGVGIACGQHGCGWRAGFDTFLWRTGFRTPEECYRFNPKSPYIRVDEAGKVRWRQGFDSLKLYDSDPSTCVLRVNDDGTINLQIGEVDHGQGALTTMAIIVSEELGVKLEDIKVSFGDTDAGAFGLGTYASRVTTIGGRAVLDAAKKAKALIFKHASNMLEASPDSLVARDGKVFIRDDPERFVTFADAAFQAYASRDGGHVIVEGYYDAEDSVIPDAETGQGSVSVANLFFAQAIEVEVDTETGEVEVKRIFAAKDAGRIINPVGAEGQVQGAVSQGLGYALSEDIVMEKGRVLNPNFLKYVTPSAVDMPPLDIHFAETYEPAGPYGAKGLGEPALVPVAPAIANAVHDATGVRIYSLPITPEKILHGLKRSKT
ncbi:MAG: xanthine dehydrogenase family protein molybdopterin-binding subunit, partial [Candidatus Bathyarchaeia archaeon]